MDHHTTEAIWSSRDAAVEECKRLRSIVNEIHAWAVCGCIASPEDMMQNIERICEITDPGYTGSGNGQ